MTPTIGVVIPARDEAESIDACLTAVLRAATQVDVRVLVVVVADGCLDDTAARARRHPGVAVLETAGSNVGGARAAGARLALRRRATWLASTDADSIVPVDWLATHLELARDGAEVVIGAVHPRFADLTVDEVGWWHRTHDDGQALGNIHGANLGVASGAYRRAGGYLPLPEHEDTDLVRRLRLGGAVVVATERGMVQTSGRHVGRTPGGYARYLREDLPASRLSTP